MARTKCTDQVVGAILSRWRYDISGIPAEMRRDYEQHFIDCQRCRTRQKYHRWLDVSLTVLTALAAFFFLFAFLVIRHIKPLEHVAFKVLSLDIFDMYHMLISAAIAGILFSIVALALVLMTTPTPIYLGERAKSLEERLPESIRPARSR